MTLFIYFLAVGLIWFQFGGIIALVAACVLLLV